MKGKIRQMLLFLALVFLLGAVAAAVAADAAAPQLAAGKAPKLIGPRSPMAFTTVITINTTADTTGDPQTRTCYYTGSIYNAASDGQCNLRRALVEASHRPPAHRPILISFNIPTTDTHYHSDTLTWEIVMEDGYWEGLRYNNLSEPDGSVTIDGDTQPGGRTNGYPKIIINSEYTLDVLSENNTIRNLAFNGGGGIMLNEASNVGGYNLVESVWMGLNAEGTEIVNPDPTGIVLNTGSVVIVSDGNIISDTIATGSSGIKVQGDDNILQYNTIGTRGDKTVPAGRLTCVASLIYNPAQWYGGWGFDVLSGSNNQIIHNTIAGAHSLHSETETAPPAIWTGGYNTLVAYNTIGIDGDGQEVGTCGQGIFVTGQGIQVLNNTIVNARTSFFDSESDDPTEGAIFVNDGSPLARQFTIRNNIVRDSTGKVIEYGPAIPESLRLFDPPRIVSISGTLVVGETEPGYDCPNCLVELYLDDLSEGQDALELLTTAVLDDVAGTARFTATLPSPLPADHGIRLTATTQDDYVIGDYLSGTTTLMSPAYGIDATFTRELAPGWNLFSVDVTPPSSAIADVLSSLAGQYDVVLAFDGGPAGGGKTYDPANPGSSDLTTVDVLHGYWINITAATTRTLTLDYEPARNDTAIPLYTGWNLVSYLPDVSMPVTQALASIDGDYDLVQSFDGAGKTYMPGQPLYSDLTELEPGFAYWIKASGTVTLTYPGYMAERRPAEIVSSSTAAQGAAASYFFTPTTEWVDFYGVASLSGYSAPRNASVVAYDPSGVVAGAFTVHTSPYYGFLHVYADDPRTVGDEGAEAGDEIRFTIDGRLATPSKSTTWTSRGDATELNLSVAMPFQATNEWSDFWGALTLDGEAAPVGTIVAAYDPTGLYIGDYVLTQAGSYGFLHAYGDDPSTTGVDEGAEVGDALSFKAFLPLSTTPITLTASGSATWQGRGSRTELNLYSGTPGAVAPSAVTVDGPTSGEVDAPYTFAVTVDPASVTIPLTYVIEYTDQASPWVTTSDRELDLPGLSWAAPGTKHITVTTSNQAGSRVGTHTIVITQVMPSIPPKAVNILGRTYGQPNTPYTFSVTINPLDVTKPLDYIIEYTDGAPETVTAGQSIVLGSLTWPTTGVKTITVTASNEGGSVVGTHAITIVETIPVIPPSAVQIEGPAYGQINVSYTFTVTVYPPDVTRPLTYVLDHTDLTSPVVRVRNARVYVPPDLNWSSPGVKHLTATVSNQAGSAVGTHTIVISAIDLSKPPVLLSPAHRTITDTDTLTFNWDPVAGAAGYLFNLGGVVVDVGDTSYVTGPLATGSYTWTVAAYDNTGNTGPFARVWALAISGPPLVHTIPSVSPGQVYTFGAKICGSITFTSTGDVSGVTVTYTHRYPSINGNGLPRHYDVAIAGSTFEATLVLCYEDADLLVAGIDSRVEGQLHAYRYVGGGQPWQKYSEVDTVQNTVTVYDARSGVWGLGVAADYPTAITLQAFAAMLAGKRVVWLGVLVGSLCLLAGAWYARRRARRCS